MGDEIKREPVAKCAPETLEFVDVMSLRGILEREILASEEWMAQYCDRIPNDSFHTRELERKKELLRKLSSATEFHGRTF